jgi:MFS family permease
VPNARARPCEEAAIQSIRVVRDCAASAKPWVLLATILASSIAYLDESIVNVALPAIETELAASVSVIQWLINAYTLTLCSLLLVGGAAGDRFGRRRLFIIGISIFAAAWVWCGISPNVTQLISARQGYGLTRSRWALCAYPLEACVWPLPLIFQTSTSHDCHNPKSRA